MTARWWDLFRVTRRQAIGVVMLAVLVGVCVVGAMWRASWIGNRLLRDWAVKAIANGSGGVYQMSIGRVRFDWALRRVAVDSIALATGRAINASRQQSLPGVRLALSDCTISGVHFFTLVRGAGLVANSFGCGSGSLMVQMPLHFRRGEPGRPRPVPAGRASRERQAFLVLQQGVRLPSYAPRIRIAQVLFPRMALDIRLPRTASGSSRFELERLQWSMADVVIDPTDPRAADRPLFSRSIDLVASNFVTHPDRATAVHVGMLRTSLTDSTLEARDVAFVPSESGAEFRRSRPSRHDLINLTAGHITARGIDFGAFVVGQGVFARRIEVDSFRIDITSDKRRPGGHDHRPNRTPQQWIADLDETLSLDSLRVRNGEAVYREHASGREHVGVVTFAHIEATAVNVSHFVGRRTSEDPMTLTARAHLQNAGQIDVRVVVPLDAPRFDMTFRGTLGTMSALNFNPFVRETDALMITDGQVAGITFDVEVRQGVASGTITPRFNDLSVRVTQHGSGGILGDHGILGGAARGIVSFAANLAVVRSNNPDHPAEAPRIGRIQHTFTPDETLLAFLWSSLRDGLISVVKK
jgi:hypothetical protein